MIRAPRLLIALLCCVSLLACGEAFDAAAPGSATSSAVAEGTIVARELTGFQYGNDLLLGRDGRVRYALHAGAVDLALWRGRAVRVSGRPVAGYPLDGGPPLLDVTTIEPVGP